MRLIDEQHLETPWYGSRQMTRHLHRQGHPVNRKRIGRLMQLMGLSVVYQKPNTSKPHPQHKVYPSLLRGLTIDRPNQVWCADISYIPLRRGFLYLVAIMDWATHTVLSWRLSNTLDADYCVAALEDTLARFGKPEIFNTDQGRQFTSNAFTKGAQGRPDPYLHGRQGALARQRHDRAAVALKRVQCIYLHAYETSSEVRQGLRHWIEFYDTRRPHSSLDDRTPDEAYWQNPGLGYVGRPFSLAA